MRLRALGLKVYRPQQSYAILAHAACQHPGKAPRAVTFFTMCSELSVGSRFVIASLQDERRRKRHGGMQTAPSWIWYGERINRLNMLCLTKDLFLKRACLSYSTKPERAVRVSPLKIALRFARSSIPSSFSAVCRKSSEVPQSAGLPEIPLPRSSTIPYRDPARKTGCIFGAKSEVENVEDPFEPR